MLRFCVFAFFFSIFLTLTNSFEYTNLPLGCNTILGKITCANGNQIGQNGKVVMKERDDISPDDFVAEVALNGTALFKLYGCIADAPTFELEIYLEFYDVCNPGDYHLSGTVKKDEYTYYTIKDGEKNAIITDSK